MTKYWEFDLEHCKKVTVVIRRKYGEVDKYLINKDKPKKKILKILNKGFAHLYKDENEKYSKI